MKKRYISGVLVVLVGLAALGLQCQKVTDPASESNYEYPSPEYAPPFSASDFSSEQSCQSACAEHYAGMTKDENKRHSEAMKDLAGNSHGVKELRRQEVDRHKAELKEIQEARKQCIRDCHDQGGVSGGF